MSATTIVVWILLAGSVFLLVLAIRAWRTLKEGQEYQEDLSRLSADELHAFLSKPPGSDASKPKDILYRLNALMEFERRGDPRLVPLYVALLKDPHPAVVSVCFETLKERTGRSFRSEANETEPDAQAWADWWRAQAPQS